MADVISTYVMKSYENERSNCSVMTLLFSAFIEIKDLVVGENGFNGMQKIRVGLEIQINLFISGF